jgi:hypothetical protein
MFTRDRRMFSSKPAVTIQPKPFKRTTREDRNLGKQKKHLCSYEVFINAACAGMER